MARLSRSYPLPMPSMRFQLQSASYLLETHTASINLLLPSPPTQAALYHPPCPLCSNTLQCTEPLLVVLTIYVLVSAASVHPLLIPPISLHPSAPHPLSCSSHNLHALGNQHAHSASSPIDILRAMSLSLSLALSLPARYQFDHMLVFLHRIYPPISSLTPPSASSYHGLHALSSQHSHAASFVQILACRSEERRVGKECRSRWS